jgi:SepF-like predicted cell division protein (DUF552 family)
MVSLDELNPLKLIKKPIKIEQNVQPGEYIELEISRESEPTPKLFVKVFSVAKYEDSDAIINELREGSSIIIIKAKELYAHDQEELKRFIAKIKKTADAVGAQIIGIDESYFIVAPSFVKVEKGEVMQTPPGTPQ